MKTLIVTIYGSLTRNLRLAMSHPWLHFLAIDLTLCDPSLFIDFNWKVYKHFCRSNHYLIIMENSEPEEPSPLPLLMESYKTKMGRVKNFMHNKNLDNSENTASTLYRKTNIVKICVSLIIQHHLKK